MKNNQLQLVNFEQAKKLKELGFDWDCRAFYDLRSKSQYVLKNSEPTNETSKLLKDCGEIAVLAPEIALVFQWLEGTNKMICIPNYDRWTDRYFYDIYYTKIKKGYQDHCQSDKIFKSSNLCIREALNKALDLLPL